MPYELSNHGWPPISCELSCIVWILNQFYQYLNGFKLILASFPHYTAYSRKKKILYSARHRQERWGIICLSLFLQHYKKKFIDSLGDFIKNSIPVNLNCF